MFSSGHKKYEKVLKEAKEKMEKDEQRDEALVLGETTATELPMDDSSTVVRTAAALRGTCDPPAVPHTRSRAVHVPPALGTFLAMRHPSIIPGGCSGCPPCKCPARGWGLGS